MTPKKAVRYTLTASVAIATLLGAQSLAFNERSVIDAQKQADAFLPSVTVVLPTIEPSATARPMLIPTSTPPLTNTPRQAPAVVKVLSSTPTATATVVPPTGTPSPTATSTQPPTATKAATRVVVATQQPVPQSRSSRH